MTTPLPIYIGIGSNIGDKAQNLREAIDRMEAVGCEIRAISKFYQTPPWGITEQDSFLNAAVEIEFEGTAESLLTLLLQIETDMGRIREVKWGPRLIDIDILSFRGMKMDTESLKIPHPFISERLFVLIPLADIAPRYVLEDKGITVSRWLDEQPEDARNEVVAVDLYEKE